MADLSDVENALVALIATTLYPNGSEAPSSLGLDAKVYAGWPQPSELEADLAAEPPVAHVSVYPRPEEHNTTRYPLKWVEASRNVVSLTLAIGEVSQDPLTGTVGLFPTITIGGVSGGAANPQNVMALVNGKAYVHAVQPADTPESIASALAQLIGDDLAGVSAFGPTVTLPATARLQAARVGATGTIRREMRRQERLFQIGIWAATPKDRDSLAKPIDLALASSFWLSLSDGTTARLIFRSSVQSDALQKERAYRRDLLYTAEYPMIEVQGTAELIVMRTDIDNASSPGAAPIVTVYS
ncbi:MAG: hypothetical protein ACREUT_20330 [Steroidobacteraceae bacterium]